MLLETDPLLSPNLAEHAPKLFVFHDLYGFLLSYYLIFVISVNVFVLLLYDHHPNYFICFLFVCLVRKETSDD